MASNSSTATLMAIGQRQFRARGRPAPRCGIGTPGSQGGPRAPAQHGESKYYACDGRRRLIMAHDACQYSVRKEQDCRSSANRRAARHLIPNGVLAAASLLVLGIARAGRAVPFRPAVQLTRGHEAHG